MLKTCLIVGLGSMLGGMLRFWVARITPPAVPFLPHIGSLVFLSAYGTVPPFLYGTQQHLLGIHC